MKQRMILLAGTVTAAVLASAALPVPRVLVWNATPSVPTGLYQLGGTVGLRIGERVAIDPPERLRHFLAARGYLPFGMPLMKEIAALPGDTVCRKGRTIMINDLFAGEARTRDSHGRPLPDWQGCRNITPDELFVMNPRAPGSFDGRYFGPVTRAHLIGRASPVWTAETGDGAHVWFARPSTSATPNDHEETKS